MGAFDDDIKKRAGDFKLEPRDEVWDRIEQELDEKKRRRPLVWLWWLLPLLLVGGVAIVWFKPQVEIPGAGKDGLLKIEQQKHEPLIEPADPANPEQEEIHVDRPTEKLHTQHTHPTTGSRKDYPIAGSLPADQLNESEGRQNRQSPIVTSNRSTSIAREQVEMPLLIGTKEPGKVSADTSIPDAWSSGAPSGKTDQTLQTIHLELANDSASFQPDATPTEGLKMADSIKPGAIKPKNKQDRKGTWKLLAGVGMHNMGGQQLSLGSSVAEFNDRLGNNNSTTGGGFSNPSQRLSPPKAGPGIMLGMERQLPLGSKNRWSLNAGMHYQYQSITMQTGQRRDSVLQGISGQTFYYSPGQALEHKGSQHRIHLLASMQWHIGKKRAFTWQNGLYGGLVLAHDYLIPYGAQVGWVWSKDQISTGYVGIETGFAFQPKRLGAGLYGQYNLSNSVKNNRLSGQYWRGIELRMTYKLHSK